MAHRLVETISAAAARIASILGPRAMRMVARFNKYVTNPVVRLWASRVGYMAVIEHRGYRSGRVYRTPVMAFVGGSTISVVLNYGENSDWVRNVLAAGNAVVTHRGERLALTGPQVLPVEAAQLPSQIRVVGDSSRKVLTARLNLG
jgi:deazaflavin-dependent oxidoreductase (nitroreductase family)